MIISFLLIGIYLYASGIFYQVELKCGSPIFGTVFIAYKFYKGPYSNIYKAIKEINSVTNYTNKKIIGIYYDDPKKVEANKQRYIMGVILNDKKLKVDEYSEGEFEKNGYKVICITKINNAVSRIFFKRFYMLHEILSNYCI